MTLEILICTIDSGILEVPEVLTSPLRNVSYLVSWQKSGAIECPALPDALRNRADVKVITLEGKGLSRNRNNVLRHATADLCLVSDDDVRYTAPRLLSIIETFEEHPTLDLATFKFESTGHKKRYPSATFDLSIRPRGYYVSSIEIAFRRKAVQGKIEFNENFGLGAGELLCGEEELFINDALRNGLACRFFPKIIAQHTAPSTHTARASAPGIVMAKGAVIRALYPRWRHIRYWFNARRISQRTNLGFIKAYCYLLRGGRIAKRLGIAM